MQSKDSRFLTDRLKSRNSTALILSYAFTLAGIEQTLRLLSKRSYLFYAENTLNLKCLAVSLKKSKFWGRSKQVSESETWVTFPSGFDPDKKVDIQTMKLFSDAKQKRNSIIGLSMQTRPKIMNVTFIPKNRRKFQVGQTLQPNFSIDFSQLQRQKYYLREIMVKYE